MRAWPVAWCLFSAALCGCSSSNTSAPAISLSPSGTVQASGPVLITATVLNTSAPPSWTLSGAGTLSGTSGSSVVYGPPGVGAPGSATVTAAVGGASASVQIQYRVPSLPATQIPGLGAAVQVLYDD